MYKSAINKFNIRQSIRKDLLLVVLMLCSLSTWSQESSTVIKQPEPRIAKWQNDKYGMFIHWGLYAIPGWHEQHQWRLNMPREEYVKLKEQWNPEKFNPDAILDVLLKSGMKYLTFTVKHHDGFCLWDTKQTNYNTMNTPYGKDILKMLTDACHRRKVPIHLYYSVVDWNNPTYPNQGKSHELQPQPNDTPDQAKYTQFVKNQITELCTNYGEIAGIWWDGYRFDQKDTSVNNIIRRLQPNAVINNRGFDEGDFSTPERNYNKDEERSFEKPTEACQSVGMESWGYRSNEDYYNDVFLIRSIDKYLSRGANYLLNVSLDAKGLMSQQSKTVLKNIGKWYNQVKESFYNAESVNALTTNQNVMLTRKGNVLYVHLNHEPEGNVVKLRPFTQAPKSATLLNTGEKVDFELVLAPQDHLVKKKYLRLINLPTNKYSNTVLVIKLEFDILPEEFYKLNQQKEVINENQK